MIRILVSPSNVEEALECIKGGADIIDVKNPTEGSLGANFPWRILEILDVCRKFGKRMSATVGDLNLAGTASLASYALASMGVDFVKVGLMCGVGKAEEILKAVVRAVEDFDTSVVGACYADWRRVKTFDPLVLPEIAGGAGVEGVLLDTAIKDGSSTFDFMEEEMVGEFIDRAHENDLFCALAGGLKWDHIDIVRRLKPDIIGVRTLVCENGRYSAIRGVLVRRLVEEVNR